VWTDQAEVLLAPEHELADRGGAGLLHRAQQEDVGAALCLRVRRRQVVRPVEVDRVDLRQLDEPQDLDRVRALKRDRLEIRLLDHHELALRDLPALHKLLGLDVALVERAVALLLDRRPAFAVQGPERDVGALRRQGQSDGDADQAEADGSVPDRAHGAALQF